MLLLFFVIYSKTSHRTHSKTGLLNLKKNGIESLYCCFYPDAFENRQSYNSLMRHCSTIIAYGHLADNERKIYRKHVKL